MTLPAPRERSRHRARARRRQAALRWFAGLVVLGLAFFAGLAVGRALEDVPQPGGTQTLVRTLVAGTVRPEPETVTVTTAGS